MNFHSKVHELSSEHWPMFVKVVGFRCSLGFFVRMSSIFDAILSKLLHQSNELLRMLVRILVSDYREDKI